MHSCIKKFAGLLVVLTVFLVFKTYVHAADTLVFDSTDHYLGACSLTNKSEWTLKEPINVTVFEVWYSWNQGETELPVKVFKDGELFAEFTATRGNCDPYQHQWCNADFKINKLFPKGTYITEIPTNRQCLKPGGTGAIRLYKDDGASADDSTTTVTSAQEPTVTPTPTPTPIATKEELAITPTPSTQVQVTPAGTASCNCNAVQTAVTAAGTSFIVSLLMGMLLRRR